MARSFQERGERISRCTDLQQGSGSSTPKCNVRKQKPKKKESYLDADLETQNTHKNTHTDTHTNTHTHKHKHTHASYIFKIYSRKKKKKKTQHNTTQHNTAPPHPTNRSIRASRMIPRWGGSGSGNRNRLEGGSEREDIVSGQRFFAALPAVIQHHLQLQQPCQRSHSVRRFGYAFGAQLRYRERAGAPQ